MVSSVAGGVRRQLQSVAQSAMRDILDSQLNAIRESGTWKSERIIVTSQGPSVHVQNQLNPVLNFCANNYLGLSVSNFYTSNKGRVSNKRQVYIKRRGFLSNAQINTGSSQIDVRYQPQYIGI